MKDSSGPPLLLDVSDKAAQVKPSLLSDIADMDAPLLMSRLKWLLNMAAAVRTVGWIGVVEWGVTEIFLFVVATSLIFFCKYVVIIPLP